MEIAEAQYVEKYLIFGLVGILVLLLFIITLIVMYNKKVFLYKEDLHKNQLDYKTKLLRQSLIIEEATMDNIAKNLHDDVGAYLSILNLNMDTFRKLQNTNDEKLFEFLDKQKEIITTVSSSVRWAVSSLRTPTLKKFGLLNSLEYLILNIIDSSEIEFQMETNEVNLENLDSFEEVQLYRIISELLHNLIKHAKPNHVNLSLTHINKEFIFDLTHDGIGISMDEFRSLSRTNKGTGLQSIITRSEALNAIIHFDKGEASSSIVLRLKEK